MRAAALVMTCGLAAATVHTSTGRLSPATQAMLRGFAAMTDTPPAIDLARRHFERATVRDPSSAHAWAWLAYATARLASGDEVDGDAWQAMAQAAAQRATALDPQLWAAHAAVGYLASQQHDRTAMDAAFERAIALGAGDARLFIDYACALKDARDFQRALAVVERGLARNPKSAPLLAHRGLHLHAVGRYGEELPALLEAVALDPRAAEAHFHLGLGYARRAQYAAALASLQAAVTLSDGAPQFLSWFGRIAADAGRRGDAEAALHELRRRASTSHVPAQLIDAVAYHLAAARS